MKPITIVIAGLLGVLSAMVSFSASAADANLKTVAALNQEKATLAGRTISAKGKVVKVNNGIMGRNFVPVQEGTGDANSNNLVDTSNQTASVGDTVTISGVVVVNRDFGSGYAYPLLIDEASITVAK